MKQIKFLAMMIAATIFCLGFSSCGDDDDEDDAVNNMLVGTWVGAMNHEGGYNREGDEVVTMTFTPDGKMTAKGVSETHSSWNWSFTGTYQITTAHDGAVNLISIGGYFADEDEYYDDDIEPTPFYLNDNVLIISFDGSDYRLIKQ